MAARPQWKLPTQLQTANEVASHPPHPVSGRFWPILQSNTMQLQHLALTSLQAQTVFETKTKPCILTTVSSLIYMTKCCNAHMWVRAGRMHPTSDCRGTVVAQHPAGSAA